MDGQSLFVPSCESVLSSNARWLTWFVAWTKGCTNSEHSLNNESTTDEFQILAMSKQKSALAQLAEVRRVLAKGGLVRFVRASCHTVLISPGGKRLTTLDAHTYGSFLKTLAPSLQETSTGSIETEDLVIEWKVDS